MVKFSKVQLLLLLVLPISLAEASFEDHDYADYNDRVIINPGSEPLNYAEIYEGIFSYENMIIMQIQNLFTFVVTALAWALVQVCGK